MGVNGRSNPPTDAENRHPEKLTDGGQPVEDADDIPEEVQQVNNTFWEAKAEADREEATDPDAGTADSSGTDESDGGVWTQQAKAESSVESGPEGEVGTELEEEDRESLWEQRERGLAAQPSLDEEIQDRGAPAESSRQGITDDSQQETGEGLEAQQGEDTLSAEERLNKQGEKFRTAQEAETDITAVRSETLAERSGEPAGDSIEESRIGELAEVDAEIEALLDGRTPAPDSIDDPQAEAKGETDEGDQIVYTSRQEIDEAQRDEQTQGLYVASGSDTDVEPTNDTVSEAAGLRSRQIDDVTELYRDLSEDVTIEEISYADGVDMVRIGGDGRPEEVLERGATSLLGEESTVSDRASVTELQNRFRNLAETESQVMEQLESGSASPADQAETMDEVYGEFDPSRADSEEIVAVRTTPRQEEVAAEYLSQQDAITGAVAVEDLEGYILVKAPEAGAVEAQLNGDTATPHAEEVVGGESLADQVARFEHAGVGDETEHLEALQAQSEDPVAAYSAMQLSEGTRDLSDEYFREPDQDETWDDVREAGFVGDQQLNDFEGIKGQNVWGFAGDVNTIQELSEKLEANPASGQATLTGAATEAGSGDVKEQIKELGETTQQVLLSDAQCETLAEKVRGYREVESRIEEATDSVARTIIAGQGHRQRMEAVSKAYEDARSFDSYYVDKEKLVSQMVENGDRSLIDDEFVAELPDKVGEPEVEYTRRGEVRELIAENAYNGIQPETTADILSNPVAQARLFTDGFNTDGIDIEQTTVDEMSPLEVNGEVVKQPTVEVEGKVVSTTSSERLEDMGGDIFQRVKIQDTETGALTDFTVFADNVEYPDSETHGSSTASGTGAYDNLADEGIHPEEDQLGKGDTVKIKGGVVNDGSYTVGDNFTLSAHPNTELQITDRQSSPDERPVGEKPSPEFSRWYAAPGDSPRSPGDIETAVETGVDVTPTTESSAPDGAGDTHDVEAMIRNAGVNPEDLNRRLTAVDVSNDRLQTGETDVTGGSQAEDTKQDL